MLGAGLGGWLMCFGFGLGFFGFFFLAFFLILYSQKGGGRRRPKGRREGRGGENKTNK